MAFKLAVVFFGFPLSPRITDDGKEKLIHALVRAEVKKMVSK